MEFLGVRHPGIFTGCATPPADSNHKSSAMYNRKGFEVRLIVTKIDRDPTECQGLPQQHRHRCTFVPYSDGG